MASSKSYVTRLRMNKQIDFSDDFRKRFMTREYGNYKKYEGDANSIKEEVERGEDDAGYDKFHKNYLEMQKRTNSLDSETHREREKTQFEDLLQNEAYADENVNDRHHHNKVIDENPEEIIANDAMMRMS